MENIRKEVLSCTKCDLSIKSNPVPGVGNPDAFVMLVGEAPGYHENKLVKPFVGESGKHLDKYLNFIKLQREDTYITNAVKCRPERNRDPNTHEIKVCKKHLVKEIVEVKPIIIVLLGKIAYKSFFGIDRPIKDLRLKWIHLGRSWVITTYHPAFLLRNDPDGHPTIALKDFLMIRNKIKEVNPYYNI